MQRGGSVGQLEAEEALSCELIHTAIVGVPVIRAAPVPSHAPSGVEGAVEGTAMARFRSHRPPWRFRRAGLN